MKNMKNMKNMSPFKAMKYAGVDRNYLRPLSKADRLLAWMMIVMTLELTLTNP